MIGSIPFLPEFWSSLFLEGSTLIVTLLTGIIFLTVFQRKTLNKYKGFNELFISLFLGIVIIGVFTAIIITKGVTIFIFCPLFVVLILWATRTSYKNLPERIRPLKLKPSVWIPLILAVNILAFLLTYYFLIVKTNGGLNCDQVFYGQVSYSLGHTGIETSNFSWLRESIGLNPYHYLELWYVSLAQKIFNLGPGVYVLIWYPISLTLVFFGIALLIENLFDDFIIGSQRIGYIISGVMFFFILTPCTKLFLGTHNNLDDLKAALATSLMILIYYAYIKRGIYLALWVSLAMIFVYPPITPAIYSGVFTVTLYLMLNKKSEWDRSGYLLISIATVFAALYFFFYYTHGFFSSHYLDYTKTSQLNLYEIILHLISQLGRDLISVIIYFIPVFFIVFLISIFTKSRIVLYNLVKLLWQEKVIFIFICSGLFFSKIVSLLAEKYNHDLVQTYSIFYDLTVHLALFSLIIYLVLRYLKASRVYIFSISFLFYFYFSITLIKSPSPHFFKPSSEKFEPEFWSEIYNTVNRDDRKFVFIPNDKIVKNEFEKNNLLVYPLQRMIWIKNTYYPLNLTENTKLLNNKQDFASSFLKEHNFIAENNVGFIILENGAFLNPLWTEFIKKRIPGEDYCVLCLNDIKSID